MSTKHFAVIGDPIKHSLSPVMHNAALKELGVDGDYRAIHVPRGELGSFIEEAKETLDGFNITVPHKQDIIPFLDEITPHAHHAQSVNTVTIKNGKLFGTSTDGYGLTMGLKEAFDLDIKGKRIMFLGCGGAVQAVSFYFLEQAPAALYFVNRTLTKADNLKNKLQSVSKTTLLKIAALDDDDAIQKLLLDTDLIIQGTSLGLSSSDPSPIAPNYLKGKLFYDTIYKETPLQRYAKENNIPYADGRAMLLHQGAKSLAIWTKRDVPIETMRNALYSAIG